MPSQGSERRLAAILHADVVGYSRLMAEDEDSVARQAKASAFPLLRRAEDIS